MAILDRKKKKRMDGGLQHYFGGRIYKIWWRDINSKEKEGIKAASQSNTISSLVWETRGVVICIFGPNSSLAMYHYSEWAYFYPLTVSFIMWLAGILTNVINRSWKSSSILELPFFCICYHFEDMPSPAH